MGRMLFPVGMCLALAFFSSCGDKGGNDLPDDPYEGLRDVAIGEVECNGDSCCLKRCWGDNDTICATRVSEYIVPVMDPPLPDGCDHIAFPEWFYNLDCFINIEIPDLVSYGDDKLYLWVQCFCGRTATTYSSEYSATRAFDYAGCGIPFEGEPSAGFVTCDHPCDTCTPRCSVRECGSDGCGGSCGTCDASKTCNAAGHCVASGGEDTCSECLAACRGHTSCCTGCGCLCEEECGMCW